MRKEYGKLIRDRIPEIMDAKGVRYEVAELSKEAYRKALLAKVVEEAREVSTAESQRELIKEIADLFEALESLMTTTEIDEADVREMQRERREERGGFARRLELLWTEH